MTFNEPMTPGERLIEQFAVGNITAVEASVEIDKMLQRLAQAKRDLAKAKRSVTMERGARVKWERKAKGW